MNGTLRRQDEAQIRQLMAEQETAMRARGFDLWFRATDGLRKVDGRWQVTHEHNSTPFYMDGSLKAAVDLEP